MADIRGRLQQAWRMLHPLDKMAQGTDLVTNMMPAILSEIEAAVKEEREACARLVESGDGELWDAQGIPAAIRARGGK